MDLSFFIVKCVTFTVLSSLRTASQGIDLDVCETDPTGILNDGIFETHTFEAEEGILLVPRKLIGTITLSGNDSSTYSFDEPYFTKPYNLKSKPRPAHFEVVFVNVSPSYNSTTTLPKHDQVTSTEGSSSSKAYLHTATPTVFHHSTNVRANYGSETTSSSTVTSSSMNVTSSTTVNMTSTTAEPITTTPDMDISCVVAKIYQIYDLDREDSDTHYLTISNSDDYPLWGGPVVVVIKVTDINDNSPTFVKDTLNTRISKKTNPGSIVAEVKAIDKDIGINADLRYSLRYSTERRGNETDSPDFPTFFIHETRGIVALVSPISDLVPPTKISFSVVVKDKGDSYVANRATASVTISIVNDTWAPEVTPADQSITISGGAIVGIILGSITLGVIATVAFIYWRKRSRHCQRNGHLELMLDDENLISA